MALTLNINGQDYPIDADPQMPLLWAIPFFYACLEENLPRGVVVTLVAILAQAALAATAFVG